MTEGDALHYALFQPDLFSTKVKVGGIAVEQYNEFKNIRKPGLEKYITKMGTLLPDMHPWALNKLLEKWSSYPSLGAFPISVPLTDLIILSESEMNHILRARDAVMENPEARRLITGGYGETTVVMNDKEYGFLKKIRPDYLNGFGLCVDGKKTKNASVEGFFFEIKKYRYDIQAVYYSEILEELTGENHDFIFLAIEIEYPYHHTLQRCPRWMLEKAKKEISCVKKEYAHCLKTNNWPKYGYNYPAFPIEAGKKREED